MMIRIGRSSSLESDSEYRLLVWNSNLANLVLCYLRESNQSFLGSERTMI